MEENLPWRTRKGGRDILQLIFNVDKILINDLRDTRHGDAKIISIVDDIKDIFFFNVLIFMDGE